MASNVSVAGDGPGRLLVVSNRGPYEFVWDDNERLAPRPAPGGVATALRAATAFWPTTWLSSAMTPGDRIVAAQTREDCRFVLSDPDSYRGYYDVFASQVLWLLQHEIEWPAELTPEAIACAWRDGYVKVNREFAHGVARQLRHSEIRAVMFHDYHLYLAPGFVREAVPDAYLQQFVHIPWPCIATWKRLAPQALASICEGLLANDSIAFQTAESARNFLITCQAALAGVRVDHHTGSVTWKGRDTRVWSNPISVSPIELARMSMQRDFVVHQARLRPARREQLIVRVDRLDPSKNVLTGFDAYEALLTQHPELLGKVSFLALLVPTRDGIPLYRRLEQDTFDTVCRINKRFGTEFWRPIHVMYANDRLRALAAMSVADVLLVNSLADGMNLVAKEGALVSEQDAVLVLSQRAGAYEELAAGAIGIDPSDVDGTAAALHQSLVMAPAERARRASLLRQAVLAHDLRSWFGTLLDDIGSGLGDEGLAPRRVNLAIPA